MEEKGSLDDSLEEVRRQIQESLNKSKRERLRDEYGIQRDYVNSNPSPELQNEFLDYVTEFERQAAEGRTITVRERIGSPPVRRLAEVPAGELESTLDALLQPMLEHNLVVDFLGTWDEGAAYQYLTETLLDHEIDDIQIEGTYCHLEAVTPEFEVEAWAEDFVQAVFWQARNYLLAMLEPQQLCDTVGVPVTLADFVKKLEEIWARLPVGVRCDFQPVVTRLVEDEAVTAAIITWQHLDEVKEVEVQFRLQSRPYYGWDIVQTSLVDVLLAKT